MSEVPKVQTVAEMWETWRTMLPPDADVQAAEKIRAAFYGGFSAAILNLLSVGPDHRTHRIPEGMRTHQLETWDAEITEEGVRRIGTARPNAP
jgi:hypothetical protein